MRFFLQRQIHLQLLLDYFKSSFLYNLFLRNEELKANLKQLYGLIKNSYEVQLKKQTLKIPMLMMIFHYCQFHSYVK